VDEHSRIPHDLHNLNDAIGLRARTGTPSHRRVSSRSPRGLIGYPEERFDISSHRRILRELSKLIDQVKITSIVTKRHVLNVLRLIKRHNQIESGTMIRKIAFTIPDIMV
jgi:hypothetical protein